MSWLYFALMAPVISASVNFLDKYIVKGLKVNFAGMPIFAASASFFLGSLIWITQGLPIPRSTTDFIVIFAGLLAFIGSILYFKAINTVAVSKIIILFQLTPFFVLILTWLFLDEQLTRMQLIGFCLVVAASIGLARKGQSGDDSIVPTRYFLLIIGVDFVYASSSVLIKYATETTSVGSVYAFQTWGLALGALILFCSNTSAREGFKASLKYTDKWPLILVFLNEGLFNVGKLLSIEATSMTSVALVNVVGSTQVFFGIFFGWILNRAAPTIFEESSSGGLVKEMFFAAMMFSGVYLLY